MPNTKNINRVIRAIRAEKIAKFNLMYWWAGPDGWSATRDTPACDTAACIGGFAEALLRKGRPGGFGLGADGFLGLDYNQGTELFYPDERVVPDYRAVTKEQAIAVLEHLRDTGEVNWNVAFSQ